jgi:CheY-like chemotaxis protein
MLQGDALRLRQILINLISNAIKFTNQGKILVKIKISSEDATTIELHCSVEDTGIGIPAEKQAHIFEIFEQAESSISRKYGGTGLGLAISKQLLQLMQGELGLESQVGQGSIFWFKLRFGKCPLPATDQAAGKNAAESKLLPHYNLVAKRILVAEDYEVSQELMKYQLTKAGCLAIIAKNGQEAIRFAEQQSFDLIFMDVQMPVLDGYEATKSIRAMPAGLPTNGRAIPIIGLTASGFTSDIEQCYAAGMDDVIIKPIHRALLLKKLAYWLEKAKT